MRSPQLHQPAAWPKLAQDHHSDRSVIRSLPNEHNIARRKYIASSISSETSVRTARQHSGHLHRGPNQLRRQPAEPSGSCLHRHHHLWKAAAK